MSGGERCVFLPWDSEFFGVRIGRVVEAKLDAEAAAEARDWAEAHAVQCLYSLVDAGDLPGVRAAEDAGFRQVDLRVTRERRGAAPEPAEDVVVEPMRAEDLPAVREIARTSHRNTRFYADPRFPRERCDALYVRWIERSVERGDLVLVAREGGRVIGYVACEEPPELGRIGLIAAQEEARGRGVGRALLAAALAGLAARGRERVEVVAQGRNLAAARLYEAAGFRSVALQHWYHLWLDEAPTR